MKRLSAFADRVLEYISKVATDIRDGMVAFFGKLWYG